MILALYNLLLHAILPVLLVGLVVGRLRRRAWAGDLIGQLQASLDPPAPHSRPVLCHAASVGETRAMEVLLEALRERHPEIPIVLSTSTITGRSHASRRAMADHVTMRPLDYPGLVASFFARVRPRLVLVAETEIWPNFLLWCRRSRVPVIYVNGRLSSRHETTYRRFHGFYERVLAPVDLFLMQGDEDARRLRALGVDGRRVQVVGDLKADQALRAAARCRPAEIRDRLGLGPEPVLVAGSTHPGEDLVVLEAFARLRARHPRLRMLLAPRHLDRVAEIDRQVRERGLGLARLSTGPAPSEEPVLLLDTLGLLADAYSVGTVAFVGGSISLVGGHSVVEPAVHGCPVVVGPHGFNFVEEIEALRSAGALEIVEDAPALVEAVERILEAPERARESGRRGLEVVRSMAGALERSLAAIEERLA